MRLAKAAIFFDKISVYDGYSNAFLWKAQFNSFDARSSVDGNVNRRRNMSLAPGLIVPTRRTIRFFDERWIVGDGNTDGLFDAALRQSFTLKKVTDLAALLTPGQAALNSAGITAYCSRSYFRPASDGRTTSELDPQYTLFFSSSESQVTFVRLPDGLYNVRVAYRPLEGYLALEADKLDTASIVSCSFAVRGAYVPATDSYTTSTVATTGVLAEAYQFFNMRTEADPERAPGDHTLIVAASAITPKAGDTVTIAGEAWRVFSIVPFDDAWELRIRR